MTDDAERLLSETATAWGFALSERQLAQFRCYLDELIAWNDRFNLTAVRDRAAMVRRHLLDSLWLARDWQTQPANLLDIGSGAGFPALPLKILYPALPVTLVEATGKKAEFLRHIADCLELNAVRVLNERIEMVGRNPAEREHYEVVTARAVAELRVLVEYALPLLRIGGRLLAPKGRDPAAEISAARNALTLLGGEISYCQPVDIPGEERRSLVIVTKIAPTPDRFPRAVGVPARRPL
ncbi:16S rRNA (guanine(527)-N(7))-methyltransferase RsmG [Chloroflexus sp.]|uniref:16S rRNA (guanine(527)-N(7))-methyltransferase RsmG n=1 Tax=Chloroflexus sp. TaxID=1904827 RepID=UPI00298F3CCD|nr:16S rRNA (guanine(527)-N(7))-methyltransferase RsmG [Chloroflexus sp.]MCS6887290.1 16S rRNA (guanine(527)-N(7))-methyltransferase RsmG [Chloroflexus sp.]MDW8404410.1 16S rRNA (guanine(527)-N(7))-methyltransferase RsmG [Chloroflexus sp.]